MTPATRAHLVRTHYAGTVEALHDVLRVLEDLDALGEGQMLIPANEIEFLVRRAGGLVAASIDVFMRESTRPPPLQDVSQ